MRKTNDITRTLRRPFACFALCALALAGAMSETGCRKIVTPAQKGDNVLFSAGVGGSESGTKTAYANDHVAGDPIAESINWLSGDQIRIWCAECSEPTTDTYGNADHFADYTVTPAAENGSSSGEIAVNPGTVGLRWGDAGTTHHFYAVYPSPNTTDKGDAGAFGESGSPKPFTFTGHIPATQKIKGNLTTSTDGTTTIAAPDMSNLYMVSKTAATPEDKPEVFLKFTPLTTAIQFTIQNDMSEGNLQVESVKIMSDPKTGDKKNLAGAFSADISGWTPATSGSYTYPTCTQGTTGLSTELSIDFTGTSACTTGIAKGKELQFTFFLLPTQSIDDLSFVITRKDGASGHKTIKTRLELANGGKVTFPAHKKTYVTGILVPDGAGESLKFSNPVVTEWGSTGDPVELALVEEPQQPDDEIWYITSDGQVANLESSATFGGLTVVSNTYNGDKGIIKLSGVLKNIGSDSFSSPKCFYEQQNLIKVYFPPQVESIGYNTIRNCYYISEIYIPVSVTYLAYNFCWEWIGDIPCSGDPLYIIVGDNKQEIKKGGVFYVTLGNGESVLIGTMCFVEGTMISLADGNTKKVEELTYDDDLLVWNFDAGKYDSAKLLWISKGRKEVEYYRITLSDGSTINLCGSDGNCHRLFNYTDKIFQYPTKMEIGTEIFTQNGIAKLVSVECLKEDVTYYNLITDTHINCFADGILASCRYNNLYPIDENMKFVKDGRKKRSYSEFKKSGISREWYNGMRLGEQTDSLDNIAEYINTRVVLQQPKPAPSLWQRLKTWWKSIFG